MRNKINFISGEIYSLAELFSGERRIVIPDLQRDYCWGNAEHTEERKELVSGFVKMLLEEFRNYRQNSGAIPASRGLIYGYEQPENHIQLCDGQQRITTLFLLVGMLNRLIGDNSLRHYLITDFEYLQDDKEPYLHYAIRESSLYFLSDLVCHFFIHEEKDGLFVGNTSQIKEASWFFNEYNDDPSILSMLRALEIMDGLLKELDGQRLRSFADFLMNKVTFMYYDLENRKNGEETFVVINTTGEPLSSVQNLKPMVMDAKVNANYVNLSEDWEEIETWFWKKRMEKNGNDTADAGFTEFLRWVTMLESPDLIEDILKEGKYVFPYETISFQQVKEYWHHVEFLFGDWVLHDRLDGGFLSPALNKESGLRVISQIDCFKLLPLIAYCKEHSVNDPADRGLLRLYKFLENLVRIDGIRKDVNTIVDDAVRLARRCRDIAKLSEGQNAAGISTIILSKEELLKMTILKDCIDEPTRMETEEAFWAAQDWDKVKSHEIWSGEIMPLLQWASSSGSFDFGKFKEYLEQFDLVFAGECDGNIDDIRRALLAIQLPRYPRIFSGNTNYSFGWNWHDWKVLISDNLQVFKNFFDRLINGTDTLQSLIAGCSPSAPYYDFVHCAYLLDYCEEKNIQKVDGGNYLIVKKYWTDYSISVLCMHLLKYLERQAVGLGWSVTVEKNKVCARKGDVKVLIGNKSESEWRVCLLEKGVEKSQCDLPISTSAPYEYPDVLAFLTNI